MPTENPQIETAPTALQAFVGNAMRTYAGGFVHFDAERKRVWIGTQRLHHGFTGALLAGAGVAGLAARRMSPLGGLEWTLFGSLLMAHDWHDRSHWFERGPQAQ